MARRIDKAQIKDTANLYIAGPGISIASNGLISTNLVAGENITIGPNQTINSSAAPKTQFALTLIFGG